MNRYLEKIAAMTDEDGYKVSRNSAIGSGIALSVGLLSKRLAGKTMKKAFSGKAESSWKITNLKVGLRKASPQEKININRRVNRYKSLMDRQDSTISRYRTVKKVSEKSLYPSGAILAGSTGTSIYFRSKRDPYAAIRSI